MPDLKDNENKFSIHDRLRSFSFAFKGIMKAISNQHNLWIHISIGTLVVILGFVLDISTVEWLMTVLCIGFVISTEVFNSAVELLVDIVSPDYNKKAGLVKDMAAGAVLIAAICAAIIGLIIFIPKILNFI
jgi:diacylglycerol kinase (ATP)